MMMTSRRKRQRGIGLVELVVVIAVLGVITPSLIIGLRSILVQPKAVTQDISRTVEDLVAETPDNSWLAKPLSNNSVPTQPGSGTSTVNAPPYAVFSAATDPLSMVIIGLRLNGTNWNIDGSVHSNGGLQIWGRQNSIKETAEACGDISVWLGSQNHIYDNKANGALCDDYYEVLSSNNYIKAKENAGVSSIGLNTWTVPATTFTLQDSSDGHSGDKTVNLNNVASLWDTPRSNNKLLDGLYRVTDGSTLVLAGPAKGTVTLVADKVFLFGQSLNLDAYSQGVVVYCTGTSSGFNLKGIMVLAAAAHLGGMLLAPNGEIMIAGWDTSVADMPQTASGLGDGTFTGDIRGTIAGQHVWLISGGGSEIRQT
ncbi:MAG: type II secretion system protein [Chloroflexi bacterium]|nr:type II secretion system protein [Chloroflexota bacterium]